MTEKNHAPGGHFAMTTPFTTLRDLLRYAVSRFTEAGLAFGACRLPNDAGLVYKVLGCETRQVKAKVREFWELTREEVTGARLPPPFLWR